MLNKYTISKISIFFFSKFDQQKSDQKCFSKKIDQRIYEIKKKNTQKKHIFSKITIEYLEIPPNMINKKN